MASDPADFSTTVHHSEALKQELLLSLLNDEAPYPWMGETPDSGAFFDRLETEWTATASSDELTALDAAGQKFFATLDQAWETPQPLQARLEEEFGDRIPSNFVQAIVQRAQALAASSQPMADQLVDCVQSILADWDSDDLFVMARPYAYAMRGKESDSLEVALRSVRYAAWTELSGVEQARLSLAIARYTISQLSTPDTQSA
ncbi:MAG: hypothetical protein WBA57_18705 [Elainellaceae cyanobacterium]